MVGVVAEPAQVSVTAKKWVRKHSPARGSRRTVLLELAWDGDDAGCGAHLSTAQLVKATGLSRSTVKRALADLEAEQLIVRHRGGRGHCDACAAARHGAHVFDVVIQDQAEEAVDPNQMTLLGGVHVDQVQMLNLGQGGPGSWSRVDQQEEVEESSLSLDQVRERERQQPNCLLDAAEPQRAAPARARGAARRPVTLADRVVPPAAVTLAEQLIDCFNAAAGARVTAWTATGQPSAALHQVLTAVMDRPGERLAVWEHGVRAIVATPPAWVDGPVTIGHVFGARGAEHTLAHGRRRSTRPAGGRRYAEAWLARHTPVPVGGEAA